MTAALDRVTDYANSIANTTGEAQESGEVTLHDINEIKHDHGLRTAFNSRDTLVPVVTYYFPLKATAKNIRIHVYRIGIIRENSARGPIELKNRYCKEMIFKELRSHYNSFRSLDAEKGFWVTDYDTIWSVHPLFLDSYGAVSLPRETRVQALDRSYRQFNVANVQVHQGDVLDLSRHVSQLFRSAISVASDQDAPTVLTSGLDAMLTEFARRSGLCATTSAHKFYWTQKDNFELDTSRGRQLQFTIQALSGYVAFVRPSFDHLLLNVNTVNCPFLHKLTVQDFANRLLANHNAMYKKRNDPNATELSENDQKNFQAVMRGVRVQITDQVNGHCPDEVSRIRVITEFGKPISEQRMGNGSARTIFNHFSLPANSNHTLRSALQGSDFSVNVRKPRKKRDMHQREEWYPASPLIVHGFQPYQGQLRPHQTNAMIEYARKMPMHNVDLITHDALDMSGFNSDQGQTTLRNLGLVIDPKLVKLNARLLKAPMLAYGLRQNGETDGITPNLASWNLEGHRFCHPGSIKSMHALDLIDQSLLQEAENERNNFLSGLSRYLKTALVEHGLANSAEGISSSQKERKLLSKGPKGASIIRR